MSQDLTPSAKLLIQEYCWKLATQAGVILATLGTAFGVPFFLSYVPGIAEKKAEAVASESISDAKSELKDAIKSLSEAQTRLATLEGKMEASNSNLRDSVEKGAIAAKDAQSAANTAKSILADGLPSKIATELVKDEAFTQSLNRLTTDRLTKVEQGVESMMKHQAMESCEIVKSAFRQPRMDRMFVDQQVRDDGAYLVIAFAGERSLSYHNSKMWFVVRREGRFAFADLTLNHISSARLTAFPMSTSVSGEALADRENPNNQTPVLDVAVEGGPDLTYTAEAYKGGPPQLTWLVYRLLGGESRRFENATN